MTPPCSPPAAYPNPLTLPGADLPQVFVLRSKDAGAADSGRGKTWPAGSDHRRQFHCPGVRFVPARIRSGRHRSGPPCRSLRQAVRRTVGKAIRARHVANGVVFHTDGEAAQIEGTDKVEAVKLDNGQRLPADLVLVGIGVSPATGPFADLAQGKRSVTEGRRRDARDRWALGRR